MPDPRGRIFDRIKEVKEQNICTSIVVAAELRYGAAKKASPRLTIQLDSILHAIDVLAFLIRASTFLSGAVIPRFGRLHP